MKPTYLSSRIRMPDGEITYEQRLGGLFMAEFWKFCTDNAQHIIFFPLVITNLLIVCEFVKWSSQASKLRMWITIVLLGIFFFYLRTHYGLLEIAMTLLPPIRCLAVLSGAKTKPLYGIVLIVSALFGITLLVLCYRNWLHIPAPVHFYPVTPGELEVLQ